jgi:hypothetical protein
VRIPPEAPLGDHARNVRHVPSATHPVVSSSGASHDILYLFSSSLLHSVDERHYIDVVRELHLVVTCFRRLTVATKKKATKKAAAKKPAKKAAKKAAKKPAKKAVKKAAAKKPAKKAAKKAAKKPAKKAAKKK